jgi:hypothetical protein
MTDDNPLLKISADKCDEGELVGRHPADVPLEFLSLNFSTKNPLRAIRAKCLDCCCGSASEVSRCVSRNCALWPFRLRTNPFRKRSRLSEAEMQSRVARLRRAPKKNFR